MSTESYLFQLIIMLHLGLSIVFLLFGKLLMVWHSKSLKPNTAYRASLSAFLIVTIIPMLMTGWQHHLVDVFQGTISVNSMAATLPIEESTTEVNSPGSMNIRPGTTSASFINQSDTPFAIVSNSDNTLEVWDQVSYMLSPVLRISVLILAIGVIVQWFRLVAMLLSTRKLIRQSQPVSLSKNSMQGIAVPVLVNERINVPMAVGYLKPVIVVPQALINLLNEQQLNQILIHENAHHQRRDLWISFLCQILGSLYWWNPLLSYLKRAIHLNRELVCDEIAAQKSEDKCAYAQVLLDCAKHVLRSRQQILALKLIEAENELGIRIDQLTDSFGEKRSSVWIAFTPFVFIVALVAITGNTLSSLVQGDDQLRIFRQYRVMHLDTGDRLLSATNNSNLLGIDRLIQEGLSLDTPIAIEGTALMVAIRNGDQETVRHLLKRGADPNQAASRRGNPLILAAARGQIDIMKMLIAAGANVDAIVPRDETPLMSAARNGQLDAAVLLLQHGAQVRLGVRTAASDGLEYRTPLGLAATDEMRQLLLRNL